VRSYWQVAISRPACLAGRSISKGSPKRAALLFEYLRECRLHVIYFRACGNMTLLCEIRSRKFKSKSILLGKARGLKFMSMKNSIMLTGSRDVDRETARALFERHLSLFISQGRTWLVGTARGIDQWAMEWLLENSEICWAVVPY
jgi:hypothetical protein